MDISALYKCFTECGKVTTDSRNCPEGSMFIALKGETFNGNAYALQALEKGCQYAVVDEKEYAADGHPRILLVDDCLKALQELANYHRHKMGTRIIGITGTNGKTTTSYMLASVLRRLRDSNHISVYQILVSAVRIGDGVHILQLPDVVRAHPAVLPSNGVALHAGFVIAPHETIHIKTDIINALLLVGKERAVHGLFQSHDPGANGVYGKRNGLMLDIRKRSMFQIAHHMRRHAIDAADLRHLKLARFQKLCFRVWHGDGCIGHIFL